MPALTTEQVLRDEAKAIHGEARCKGLDGKTGAELYQELNKLDSAALCLSGGGIRSASFALGVIQALAVHPRKFDGGKVQIKEHVADVSDSLLARFHYLSTVSGGGYIGGWLSAWIARSGFKAVWQDLVGRPSSPDQEPANLAWLRAYSNYLTPQIGAMSADTWAAAAIVARNILLNWLVILPVLCGLLLLLKLYAGAIAWIGLASTDVCEPFWSIGNPAVVDGAVGLALLFAALTFRSYNIPTRRHSSATQWRFLIFDLLPTVLAALSVVWTLAAPCLQVVIEHNKTPYMAWSPNATIWYGVLGGVALYLLSWLAGRPTYARKDDFRNALIGWLVAGAIFGALVALGVSLSHQLWDSKIRESYGTAEILLLICGVPWVLACQLIAEMIYVGLTSTLEGSDSDREWLGRAAGWMLVVAVSWLVLMALVFLGSVWVEGLYPKFQAWLISMGGVSGLITALLGKSRLTGQTEKTGKPASGMHITLNVVLFIAAIIFGVALIVVTSGLIDQILFGQSFIKLLSLHTTAVASGYASIPYSAYLVVVALLVVAGIGWVASKFVNINRFSLHALYRNRIVRAFLGGSNPHRTGNPFTGFDEGDNLTMSSLWDMALPVGEARRPFHIVNIALNIVSSKKLAWQERKAEPFTVSPLHSGSSFKKYRRSDEYGHLNRGISVGTAVAVSGAAASPNMGYHSSPAMTLLMALFNVRLGWWLGNPGEEGESTYRHEGPRTAIIALLSEMFGLTTDTNRYVYLSDGGHFENLGLYEMVRRRCRFIVASDAGCDPDFTFEDLGNAVRKIRIDLGVTIEFEKLNALKKRPVDGHIGSGSPYHAIGEIDYPTADGGGEKGYILYIKPGYHGVESADICAYAMANKDFPHQGTGDQFFSESQFESYRKLGFEIVDGLLNEALKVKTPPDTSQKGLLEAIKALHAT